MSNNIKAIRISKGIKQEDLAKILGINASSLANKEAGRRPFSVEEVLLLEDILNVTVRDMFKMTKDNK